MHGDVVVGNDHAAIAFVESGEVVERADEWRQRLPAQTGAEREARAEPPVVLGVEAGLDGVGADIGT